MAAEAGFVVEGGGGGRKGEEEEGEGGRGRKRGGRKGGEGGGHRLALALGPGLGLGNIEWWEGDSFFFIHVILDSFLFQWRPVPPRE